MKELRRKIARHLSLGVGPYLLYGLIRLLYATLRVEVRGGEVLSSIVGSRDGFIGITWHGRWLLMPFLYPGKRMHVLISIHRDGELIARVVERLGFRLVRGSSKKGGAAALKEMVALLGNNKDLAITPDGPKGPAEVLKPGVAQLAKITGKTVVPAAFASSNAWRIRSWDRFLIPKPFSRAIFVVGEPLRYRDGEEMEAFRLRIESALREVTEMADGHFGKQCPGTGDR